MTKRRRPAWRLFRTVLPAISATNIPKPNSRCRRASRSPRAPLPFTREPRRSRRGRPRSIPASSQVAIAKVEVSYAETCHWRMLACLVSGRDRRSSGSQSLRTRGALHTRHKTRRRDANGSSKRRWATHRAGALRRQARTHGWPRRSRNELARVISHRQLAALMTRCCVAMRL